MTPFGAMQGSQVGGHGVVAEVGTIVVGAVIGTPAGATGRTVPGATGACTDAAVYATGCAGTG